MTEVFPHTVIAVGERPCCVWDHDLNRDNLRFCESVDPRWFVGALERHVAEVEDVAQVEQAVALSVRLTYHHALETFFALLLALFQAPHCLPAWLDLYRTNELKKLLRAVNSQSRILNAWGIPNPSWADLSTMVNQGVWDDGLDVRGLFASTWQRLAGEFLDESVRSEYNGVKHGFRAQASEMMIRVGLEPSYGEPPPPEAMQTVGASRHGSSVYQARKIRQPGGGESKHHYQLRRENVLWTLEATVQKVQLLVISMQNVLAAARVRNGVEPGTVQFHRFSEEDAYRMPWATTTGVTNFALQMGGPSGDVTQISREDLLSRLKEASGWPQEADGSAT